VLLKRYKKLSACFIGLIILYLLQVLLMPADKATEEKYGLSATQLKLLGLSVIIPYVLIWMVALIGSLRLKSYGEAIKKGKDGEAFRQIGVGMLWFAFWLPLSNIVDTFAVHYYHVHPSATSMMVHLTNYFNIILLPGIILVNSGSKKLLEIVKHPKEYLPQSLAFIYIAFSAFYTFLVLHDPARQHPTHDVSVAAYYMPDWKLILVVVIPRLVVWFIGLQAVYNLYLYRRKVKGSLYRQALDNLAKGIALVILVIIALRIFQSLSVMLNKLNLGVILLIIYVLLIIIGAGYVLVMKGARRLQKLEEL
jgi:hypothetical protein